VIVRRLPKRPLVIVWRPNDPVCLRILEGSALEVADRLQQAFNETTPDDLDGRG
jgi:hypothetical protein